MIATSKEKKPKLATDGCFLPNFCSIRVLFAVVITAELLALILSLASSRESSDFASNLSLYSLFIQWVALTWTALVCLFRSRLRILSNRVSGLLSWSLVVVLTILFSELTVYMLGFHRPPQDHLFFLFKNISISAIVAALVLRYLYLQYLWRKQVVAESEARLQSLQSRIRPHFLFNSMNTIASLIRVKPDMAEETIHDLSDLFRASLSDAKNLSTLDKELELARGYLRIEAQRLGDRLEVKWDLEELPSDAKLPALILQPLLENAVYHGIEPSPYAGRIEIVGRYRRSKVNISIRNSKPTIANEKHTSGNRMALDNIKQRLQGLFDEQAGLTHSEVEGDYQVRLFFPHPWNEDV
jgi:two-component system sensor histidine kinase AlgZ